ncbi:MAG: enoyl-CoA hydratase/isomerase family protein [Candidatus Eisenbacteria bacterium]|uniref:Enoyl-CoA hydratase/isomerase family protein n=1 Tax=Eiseniibacteriota bacterium TaxID=2212470 RepID=A0A937XA48_UNCEI|nr:enoyl-CoA hydratase/isomerase family protein [Candidatus Eisenbacteria bacterium]
MAQETVRVERAGEVARVVLARPEIRNAFNDEMLSGLLAAFAALRADDAVRVVVLTGAGEAFCAGADLHWMRRVVEYSREESYADSLRLAEMLREVYTCPKPVIARVQGPAIGGGTGLVAASDIAIASEDAFFAFTETKLGLTPAAISPYLLKRMGERNLREYCLTGERFGARRAVELGLVNAAVPAGELDAAVEARIALLLSGGPTALAVSKELIRGIGERTVEENGPYTAEVIARLRRGDEGQEGMRAFLERRKPRWAP